MDNNAPNESMTPIVGICVRYCEAGQVKDVWVDMKAVTAITWGTGNLDFHHGNTHHDPAKHVPHNKDTPDCARENVLAVDTGMCWWDGHAWVCGD